MASRHIPTMRLQSGVLFSAPDETQRFPPDEDIRQTKRLKTNNIQKRITYSRGIGNVNYGSSSSITAPGHSESLAMFAQYSDPLHQISSTIPGLTRSFIPPPPPPRKKNATLCLPMLKVSSTTMIEGTLAYTTLIQSFRNPSEVAIDEARHTFPLYDGAVITDFECTIGDERRIRGVVKSKEQAQKEYKKAVHEQAKVAALLEEHTPEIFETSIGNIPSATTVEIKIVYIQELKVVMMEGEATEGVVFIVPTSIAPRYGKFQPASGIICDGLDIKIMVSNDGSINPDGCQEESGHKVFYDGPQEMESRQRSDGSGEQLLREYHCWEHHSDKPTLTKDFVFVIQMKKGYEVQSQAIVCPPDDAGMAAMMVSIRPSDLFRNAIIPQSFSGEILFLLDDSSSMDESVDNYNGPRKVDVLREAMLLVLSGLPNTCCFNIVSWGSETWAMWEQSRKHSPANIKEAREYISRLNADLGGTDLLRAFKSTVQRRRDDSNSTQIVVLTDGELDADKPMEFVWKTRQALQNKIRFFALGIGGNVPHRLIEGIAELGGGFGDIVDTTQNPRWHSRLNRLLKSALEPDSWDCDIDIGHEFRQSSLMDVVFINDVSDTQQVPYLQAPHSIVTLHPFKFTSVFFLINVKDHDIVPQEITVTTTTEGAKKKTYGLPVKEVPAGNKVMHRLAAKAVLMDLEDAVKRESSSSALIDKNGQTIGTRYSVTSKWTSFVAVVQNEQETTTESSIVEHYKAMYDGVDFNELLIAAKLDSDNDSVTVDYFDSVELDDIKFGSDPDAWEHVPGPAYPGRNAMGQRPFDPRLLAPMSGQKIVQDAQLSYLSIDPAPQLHSGTAAAVGPDITPSRHDLRLDATNCVGFALASREQMFATYVPTNDEYKGLVSPAYGLESEKGSDKDLVVESIPIGATRFDYYSNDSCSFRGNGSNEDSVAPPFSKPIDPLNWEVAVEHQNGHGLFELPESTKGLLYLHFCADTTLVAVENLKNILHSQGKEQEVSNEVLVDTIMIILCYQTHLALEEDIWDLMMERARDAITETVGQDILEVLEETLTAAMMHQHYTTVTGVNSNEDGGSTSRETCPVCNVRWQSLRTFFCPFDYELDATHVFKDWAELWGHQKETGHMFCLKNPDADSEGKSAVEQLSAWNSRSV